MKSSIKGLLLWCLLAGLYSSAFCQATNNANATSSTDKAAELPHPNPVVEDKTTLKEANSSVPITEPSEPTSVTPPAPDTNTTTTAPPDTTTTTTPTPPDTTTPPTTTTITPNTTTPTTTTTSSTTSTTTTTTTTAAPDNSTTTTTTTPAPPTPRPPCNHFDFPSFIGGIVLTLGTLAISLVAYKFYKARNERNYHTL